MLKVGIVSGSIPINDPLENYVNLNCAYRTVNIMHQYTLEKLGQGKLTSLFIRYLI
jgi:hypothetical protein